MSGAQRLPNGNTLICDGVSGTIFEVAPDRTVVWQQHAPSITTAELRTLDRASDHRVAPRAQRGFLPQVLRDEIGMSSKQNEELDAFQNQVHQKLDTILTAEQRRRLQEMSGLDRSGFGGFTPPGQIISLSREIALKPTAEQKEKLAALQKSVDDELGKVLTVDQKARLEGIKRDFDRSGILAIGRRTVTQPASSALRALASGSGSVVSPLPPGVNPLFRALRYDAQYAGLADKHLRPVG